MAASVSKHLITVARRHIIDGESIDELNLSQSERNRIERVKYVRDLVMKSPATDPFATFKRIAAGKYDSAMADWQAARKDKYLYDSL